METKSKSSGVASRVGFKASSEAESMETQNSER